MTKDEFPFFSHQDIVYLDNAATSQKPQVVLDTMTKYYTEFCSNIHRGSHDLGDKATHEYENSRSFIATYLGADSKEIIFTRGTTESINLLAATYVKDNFQTIILSEMEHHSNIIPWQIQDLHIEVIPLDKDLNLDMKAYEVILQNNPKSFVSISHVSNVSGIINPIKEIINLAHKYECKVLIDGAQALAHLKINLHDLDVDFYAVSAHKAYGPTGIGALYGKYELLESMNPYQGGGSMIDDVSFDYATYLDPPWRFEAGTQAIAEVLGFKTALEYISSLKDTLKYDQDLLSYAKKRLLEIEGIILYTKATNVCGSISFNIKGLHHDDISILLSKQSIMVRSGHHCAIPLMKSLEVEGTIRLSFAIYNTTTDIDLTIKALNKAIRMLK